MSLSASFQSLDLSSSDREEIKSSLAEMHSMLATMSQLIQEMTKQHEQMAEMTRIVNKIAAERSTKLEAKNN